MINRKLLCLIAFLISSPAFAQKFTGSIEGSIRDSDGRPISGAIVTASSPSLIGGNATASSNREGFYRLPLLPSGTYEVEGELSGFQSVIRRNIELPVGLTLTADFTLQVAGVAEVVDVTANPPMIDVTTPAVSFNLRPEIIHSLPETRNVKNILALTPGVDDDLNAYGADGPKANTISIDGVTMSDSRASSDFDPRHGASLLLVSGYNYNWIEDVHVAAIGAPAEFGGFTGVAGSFTTRSGGNQFHGLFETFFQNESLTSTNVPNPPPEKPFKTYDINGQVGGPILRDKLWFFAALQNIHKETQPFGFDGVTTDAQTKFISKFTYKINQNQTLQGFANRNDGSIENGGAGAGVLPEALSTTRNPQWTGNVDWISLPRPQTTFELRYGGVYDHYYDDEDRPDVSAHVDPVLGTTSVNNAVTFSSKRVRHQANAVLSHHAEDFLNGDHDFRFGVEIERSHSTESYNFNGGSWYSDYMGAPYVRYIVSNAGLSGSNHRVSSYAQDEWRISDPVRLSLGLRWDHNRGTTDRGVVFANDPVAPRIGLVWTLSKDSQTVLKASYGDYYEALLEGDYHFLSDRVTAFIVESYNPSSGQWEEIVNGHQTWSSDHQLKQPFVRQFSVGMDRALPGNIPFSVHYIYRKFGNILEDVGTGPFVPRSFVNPVDGHVLTVFDLAGPEEVLVLKNPPGLYRRYDALELIASKQITGRFSLSGSFVFSRLTGNAPGASAAGAVNSSFLNDPNSLIYFPGRLKNDPTFTWKVVGSFALPLGFHTGMYLRRASGDTWNARVRVLGLHVRFPRINGEPAGVRRLSAETLLDLRVEKEFPIYKGRLLFSADLFNAFNQSYVLRVQTFFEQPNFGLPVEFNAPREIHLGIRYSF